MIGSKLSFKSFIKLGFAFTTKKPSVFPYIMGGLPWSQYFTNSRAQQFQHMLLSKQIDQTFIDLYKKYLEALEAHDLKYLNQNVDKKLLEGLTQSFPSVVVRNKDAPVTIAVHSNELIGNVGLNREFHGSEMRLKKTPQRYQDCYSAYESYSMDQNIDPNLLRLFSTKVYFKSALKLTKSKKDECNEPAKQSLTQEIHMVQFQAESKSSKFKLMVKKALSRLVNIRNKQRHRENLMRLLWGASPNSFWKITDVDRILHGNLPKIVAQFSDPNFKQKQNKNLKK